MSFFITPCPPGKYTPGTYTPSVCPDCGQIRPHICAAAGFKTPPVGVEGTLAERGKTYGLFEHQARITQELKVAIRRGQNWPTLSDDMREALDMIASKIARIMNGDPNYADSWHDIAGYATLIEKRLTPKETL